jgi:hypothetical protein
MIAPTKYLGTPAVNMPPIQLMLSEVVMVKGISVPPLY